MTLHVYTTTGNAIIETEHISAVVLTPIDPNNTEIHMASGTIFTVTSYKGRKGHEAHEAILKELGWGV